MSQTLHAAPTEERASSDVGTVIRTLLALRGRTLNDLVDVLEVSQPQISQRVNGRIPWRARELEKVAEFLDFKVALLFASPAQVAEALNNVP